MKYREVKEVITILEDIKCSLINLESIMEDSSEDMNKSFCKAWVWPVDISAMAIDFKNMIKELREEQKRQEVKLDLKELREIIAKIQQKNDFEDYGDIFKELYQGNTREIKEVSYSLNESLENLD